jgi:hypothetical protein
LLVSWYRYNVVLRTGRQPLPAASFPGLPEELKRTAAVIAIAGAHDARDAAPRLTIRYLIDAAGPGSWPGGGR